MIRRDEKNTEEETEEVRTGAETLLDNERLKN